MFSLDDINRLYAQEERPTDPEELRVWKIVRHAKHYGASKETINWTLAIQEKE